MSDNGSAYESFAFRDLLVTRGIRHKRTRPSTPRTNGKAERFIQTNLREWAYARPFATSADRAAGMCPWIDTNNASRPHSALGAKWPMAWIAALSAAAERMKTSPPEISDAEPRFAGAGSRLAQGPPAGGLGLTPTVPARAQSVSGRDLLGNDFIGRLPNRDRGGVFGTRSDGPDSLPTAKGGSPDNRRLHSVLCSGYNRRQPVVSLAPLFRRIAWPTARNSSAL
jgi:Integrase core domain